MTDGNGQGIGDVARGGGGEATTSAAGASERRDAAGREAPQADARSADQKSGRTPDQRQLAHPKGSVELVDLSRVRTRPVRWLWAGRVPMGKLTLLSGDPGLGKSFVTLDLAARVSTGVLPGAGGEGGDGGPGTVLLLSAEDDAADTIKPRLEAMRADLRHVRLVSGVRFPDTHRPRAVRLDYDAAALWRAIEAVRQDGRPPVRLVVVDPISAFLGKVDGNANAEVRGLLMELGRLAEASGAAVVCVTHLNKDGGQRKAVYRSMGSLAFTAAARVVLLVGKHPDDPNRRVIATVKNNLSRERPPLVYRLDEQRVEWLPEDGARLGAGYSADALESGEVADRESATDEAAAWLRAQLAEGPVPTKELQARAEADGVAWRTVRRAMTAVGAVSAHVDGRWSWAIEDGG